MSENLSIEDYELALWKMAKDANQILADEWWIRAGIFRKLSNLRRRFRGRPERKYPTSFSPKAYLDILHPNASEAGHEIQRVRLDSVQEGFVEYEEHRQIETVVKTIAFYLPQFHPFPENDEWWGKGFTEWTNVGKAERFFPGHYQPHCPIHLGYYDLRIPDVMEEQARLARNYGISGFAYYFYWFNGKVLMEEPLKAMLDNKRVDIPFCFIWANENWTRRWDGQENDVLIAQNHSPEDSQRFLEFIIPYLKDDRYIKIDGKPVLIVYRPSILGDVSRTIRKWNQTAKNAGFPGVYTIGALTFGEDPTGMFDATMEFPPHGAKSEEVSSTVPGLSHTFDGEIYDYEQIVKNSAKKRDPDGKVFPTATLTWDNTARKGAKAILFVNYSHNKFAQWLSSNIERVTKNPSLSPDERIVFINAWNEWAEGTHLEPDQRSGFGYLNAVRKVLENYEVQDYAYWYPTYPLTQGSDFAVVTHVHYEKTWDDLRKSIESIASLDSDLYFTATSLKLCRMIHQDFPQATVELFDNRGRDLRPFLAVLRKLMSLNYEAVLKIHGKMSEYRSDGNELRTSLLRDLANEHIARAFVGDPQVGLAAPSWSFLEFTETRMRHNSENVDRLAKMLRISKKNEGFVAGSMFWFRPSALKPLVQIPSDFFDLEEGLIDGGPEHALERIIALVCEDQGYSVRRL